MRLKQATENGNVIHPRKTNESFNINWSANVEHNSENRSSYSHLNSNSIYGSVETTETLSYTGVDCLESNVNEFTVCNRQFRINAQKNSCLNRFTVNNLEASTDLGNQRFAKGESDVYSDDTPIEDDRVFEHSDTDEMSERGVHLVPRGIVNPNYPGFQHLAHTLQDYSSTIENFYQSENDMTDDDADVEITELAYEPDDNQTNPTTECQNNNNNEINEETSIKDDLYSKKLDSHNQNEMPDLIQNLTKQNNNNEVDLFSYELNYEYSDADIENNFHTKDIIGDFNKEVEDEIKQLLNYNINIQDDLEELRKDIKDTLAKPIENTINNISDVVNHVIKKLVESDIIDEIVEETEIDTHKHITNEEDIAVTKENEKNARTEMHLSRPTFLHLDINSKIDDAFLSDGKDEIDVSTYEPDKLSQNVENTIKQLSTELRKIIPKLDEMRQRDRLWAECNKEAAAVATDGNSNEIRSPSNSYSFVNATVKEESSWNSRKDPQIAHATIRNLTVKTQIEPRESKDLQKDVASSKKCYHSAHSNSSVLKNDSGKDLDLESFDVYNIETALPKLDIDAIENHLRAAKEAERRKRNDREEIRKRLAMGAEAEEYYSLGYTDRPGKKPSLHSRLQNGMNLQICFMNETASDNESQSELDKNISNYKSNSRTSLFSKNSYNYNHPYQTRPLSVNITKHDKMSSVQSGTKLRPTSLSLKTKSRSSHSLNHIEVKESDFFALQATLQTEARMALAQAKEMARIQMERERRSRAVSPVTEMLRRSMDKANAPLAADRRRVSRQLLTDMNIAQLQVIVNELHSQIENLNDTLVKMLMARDELHMGQDSMLVDIEDLTRYLGVKEQTKKTKGTTKTGMKRLTSLVHK